jgi:hypothetical protein
LLCASVSVSLVRWEGRVRGKRCTVLGRACRSRADWRCHSSLDVKYGIVV